MNCAEDQDLINAYLDDELEEQLRTSLEPHLSGCPDCSHEAASLRASLHRLRETFPEQMPPAALWEKVQTKTETE